MGYLISHPKGAALTFKQLRRHPNFRMPPTPPAGAPPEQVARFVLDACAMFVSPPKVGGESEEFACQDIATAIRGQLAREVLRLLRAAQAGDGGAADGGGHG